MKLIHLFFIPCLLFCAFITKSQTYHFDNYGVQDGLAQSTVYDLIQDQNGYIWLGTKSGVSRFDGKNFDNYTTVDGLAENGVTSIFQDSKKNIWFGHLDGGISRYTGKSFQKLQIKATKFNSRITSIVEDSLNRIWMSSDGSGAILIKNPSADSLTNLEYKTYKGENGLSDQIFSISIGSNHSLYFVMNIGIKSYNYTKDVFSFYTPEGISSFSQTTVMYNSQDETQWYGSWTNGLQAINLKTKKVRQFFKRDGLAENFISTITSDKKGNIWIGTWGGGISRISNDKIQTFNTENGLPDNKIWKLFIDREGNLIAGTNENGLAIYKGEQFVSYSEADGLNNNQIYAITQDKEGRFWFGSTEGITLFSHNKDQGEKSIQYFTKENESLNSNQIRFFKKDKAGNIWIGTNDNKVWQYDIREEKFYYMTNINRWFPRNIPMVTAMEIDKQNNLWVGTVEGLIYYEIDHDKSAWLTQEEGLAGNDISALYCDKGNILWVGAKGKGLTSIRDTEIKAHNLGGQYTPTSITSDKNGNIWIGTQGQGVIIYNQQGVNFKTISDGLLSNFITMVTVDGHNNIYIGTNLGLNKFNPESGRIASYTKKSGFTGIEVKNNASFIDANGNIWFGTIKGAIMFNPREERINEIEAITHIRRFTVNLQEREIINGLKLSHTEKSVTFDVSGICFTNPEKVRFMFMLEGADDNWQPATTQSHISYSALQPGKYTFKVKACNDEGIWNKQAVKMNFKIRPPFWKTLWFYFIIFVIIVMSIVLYIQIRTKNLIKEKRILEEKVAIRTREVVRQKEQIEKEKAKTEDLLLNILPIKVVDELKRTGKTEPEGFENVTVYFSDIVGFTKMSSMLEPKLLINELNDMFTAFDDIMVRNNCERLKTIGDAYLAVCGMPDPNDQHAENILKASMEIIDYLKTRNSSSEIDWTIRIGIHSGKVVGGVVGVRKYIYDVFGDTINTASRMESNSEPMRINVSETTYSILSNQYKFIDRGVSDVKGKGQMKMYFLDI